jgi:hypothetical protein
VWHFIPAAILLGLAACASAASPPSGSTPGLETDSAAAIVRKGWISVSLDYDKHPSGASKQVREAAVDAYLYAQLAQNAYSEAEYALLSHVSEAAPLYEDPKTGFAVRSYWVREGQNEPYVVVAFRGTNFTSWRDWIFGNFPFNTHYRQGLAYVRTLREQLPEGTRIVLTGHSLGGAIATYVSLREQNVPTYGFNASGRLTRGSAEHNERHMISQYGEAVAAFRRPFINAYGTYTTINCVRGNPLFRHTMRHLADCLTRIAAWEDEAARKSLELNGLGPLERVFP